MKKESKGQLGLLGMDVAVRTTERRIELPARPGEHGRNFSLHEHLVCPYPQRRKPNSVLGSPSVYKVLSRKRLETCN